METTNHLPPVCSRCGGRTDGKVSAPSMYGFGALVTCDCPVTAKPAKASPPRHARPFCGVCGRAKLLHPNIKCVKFVETNHTQVTKVDLVKTLSSALADAERIMLEHNAALARIAAATVELQKGLATTNPNMATYHFETALAILGALGAS